MTQGSLRFFRLASPYVLANPPLHILTLHLVPQYSRDVFERQESRDIDFNLPHQLVNGSSSRRSP